MKKSIYLVVLCIPVLAALTLFKSAPTAHADGGSISCTCMCTDGYSGLFDNPNCNYEQENCSINTGATVPSDPVPGGGDPCALADGGVCAGYPMGGMGDPTDGSMTGCHQ